MKFEVLICGSDVNAYYMARCVHEAYNKKAYMLIKDKKYKIEKADFEYSEAVNPNTFVGLEKDYLRLGCNNGFIKVYIVKPEGKNSMDAKSFFNGVGRNLVGEKLG